MNVTLRTKTVRNGKESIYLDITHEGKRKKEYLKLYLYSNPETPAQRKENKKTWEIAEAVRGKRLVEIQNGAFGFTPTENAKILFLDFFRDTIRKRQRNNINVDNWTGVFKYMQRYCPPDTKLSEVDERFLQGFKEFLEHAETSNGKPLSQNTKHTYYNKVKACLNEAFQEGHISHNPATRVKGIKSEDPQREYLTEEELIRLANTECSLPVLKRAALFSAITGIRWSDIHKLTWEEVFESEEQGPYIRFRQQKTKTPVTHPISQQALQLLGKRRLPHDRVFKGLKYNSWTNTILKEWVFQADIKKKITFHCFRHTYATLQLTKGTDLYTVSKLLGHKDIRTTQIYAKVVDQLKREAADKMPDLNLDL